MRLIFLSAVIALWAACASAETVSVASHPLNQTQTVNLLSAYQWALWGPGNNASTYTPISTGYPSLIYPILLRTGEGGSAVANGWRGQGDVFLVGGGDGTYAGLGTYNDSGLNPIYQGYTARLWRHPTQTVDFTIYGSTYGGAGVITAGGSPWTPLPSDESFAASIRVAPGEGEVMAQMFLTSVNEGASDPTVYVSAVTANYAAAPVPEPSGIMLAVAGSVFAFAFVMARRMNPTVVED